MLSITKTGEGSTMTIALEGRLDTNTSPELEKEAKEVYEGVDKLLIDLENLQYISSAGLRVLLSINQAMTEKGGMIVRNVPENVQEVFNITGFSEVLTIER